jgi:hypothetical protein
MSTIKEINQNEIKKGNLGETKGTEMNLKFQNLEFQNYVSPHCTSSIFAEKWKLFWQLLFLSLLITIAAYYGSWYILILNVVGIAWGGELPIQVNIIVLIVVCIAYLILFLSAMKFEFFGLLTVLIALLLSLAISLSGVLVVAASIALPFFQIVEIFVILFPANIFISFGGFYIARWLICRSQLKKSKKMLINA